MNGAEFPVAPNISAIGFTLTASTEDDCNQVIYVSDGKVVGTDLLKNGDMYTFPKIGKEGCTLIGWYDSPEYGKLYRETDIVDLDGDITLYAYWWQGDSEDVEYQTLDGCWVHITTLVSDKVIMNIEGGSPDGCIVVDVQGVDVSALFIDVPMSVRPANRTLTAYYAEMCNSIYTAAASWFTIGKLVPIADTYAGDQGKGDVELDAIRILGGDGFNLRVNSQGASVRFDHAALESLYRRCAAQYTGVDMNSVDMSASLSALAGMTCEIVIRIASSEELTEEQRASIGNKEAWMISVLFMNVEMKEFDSGRITISLPWTGSDDIHAYCVLADGSMERFDSTYDGRTATFESTHLSIYMIDLDEEERSYEPIVVTVVLIMIICISLILGVGMRSNKN